MEPSKAVLITGCSSGIGRATARRLARSGWTVYATARHPESLDDLAALGCKALALDVTDEASRRAAVTAVEAAEGAVGVLVNNAGYSQAGAVEAVPLDLVRREFETNVFGPLRLTQLVLPGMRRQGWGRIVNVGSMGGLVTFPGDGIYHASKYALEALSDALRFEVGGFGIDVALVEPGFIRTGFPAAASRSMDQLSAGPYARFQAAVHEATAGAYQGGLLAKLGGEPEAVARVIEQAAGARRPRTRYLVTTSARLLVVLRRLLPDLAWDRLLQAVYPRPGTRPSR